MRILIQISVLFLLSILSSIAAAQNSWLWAESIDRSNTWNDPFYKAYNTADKLLSYRDDSAAYCTDCSLPNILWKGIEANKITIYQLDKKSKLSVQKVSTIKTKLLAQVTIENQAASMQDVSNISEIAIYRKPDSTHTQLSELPIEWIALKVLSNRDTFSIYLKPKECFAYLNSNECKWVHPLNHHIQLNIADALVQRNYIIGTFTLVSATNLKALPNYKNSLPPIAQTLNKNDKHTSTGSLEVNTDTLLIRLQAMYSSDITSDFNRGFNKAHLIEYLLELHAENKIKGYMYHESGYFTVMQAKDLSNHLLVETMEEEDISYRRLPPNALTQLHTLKTYTKISASDRITNDWLIFGLSKEISTSFHNRYAIAFKYEDVLAALASTDLILYNGTNQKDSMRLDEALKKQYIDYSEITICSVYGDTILWPTQNVKNHLELNSSDPVSALLSEYTPAFLLDFSEFQEMARRNMNHISIETFQLHYLLTSGTNSILPKNTLLIDALLDAIRTEKIAVFKDENLSQITTATSALNKLDKARFYKTGNAKKDSLYISKIPIQERFIQPSQLEQFTVKSYYSTSKKKSVNEGFCLGIFIPAELNPQYEIDTLCYVSFNAFAKFLQKNKAYKKLYPQFVSLLNERAIVSIEDFYDLLIYDVTDENAAVPSELPVFVRERIMNIE